MDDRLRWRRKLLPLSCLSNTASPPTWQERLREKATGITESRSERWVKPEGETAGRNRVQNTECMLFSMHLNAVYDT